MNTDVAFYVLGVASLSAIAALALLTLIDTLMPRWDHVVTALFADHFPAASVVPPATQHPQHAAVEAGRLPSFGGGVMLSPSCTDRADAADERIEG